jgi:ribonuclease G
MQDMVGNRLTLRVHPEIADLLYGEENHVIMRLEEISGKQIVIYPKAELHMEEHDTIESIKA